MFANSRPSAIVTFTALNTEKPTTWTAVGEPPINLASLLAQRWNTANYWDPAQTSPVQTYANDSPVAGTFQVGVPAVTSYATTWTITDSSVPLPISLLAFTAEAKPGIVELRWKTETEVNNDFFTVQKTKTGESFLDVVTVKGAGTTTKLTSYSALDSQPDPGRWYYRLKQTDFDGRFSYSKLVTVDVSSSMLWKVYPNPSNGYELNISFSSNELGKTASIRITDVNGKEMVTRASLVLEQTEVQLEVKDPIPAGMYILSIAVEQQVSRLKLIVK